MIALGMVFVAFSTAQFYRGLWYESRCRFQIGPKWILGEGVEQETAEKVAQICEMPHEAQIGNWINIERCLSKNNLYVLDGFVDLSKDEITDFVQQNLVVKKISNKGQLYELKLRTYNPQDSATLLNNLVKSHCDSLNSEFPDDAFYDHIYFINLEVARIGNQVPSTQTTNLALGGLAGALLIAVFLIPPSVFRFNSTADAIGRIGFILVVAVGCFCTGFIGLSLAYSQTMHESEAVISIQDNLDLQNSEKNELAYQMLKAAEQPHSLLIKQYSFIERALEKNNLFVLDNFINFAKEEAVEFTQANLNVTEDRNDATKFEIKFASTNPGDSVKVLNALIQSYFEALENHCENAIQEAKIAAEANDNRLSEFGSPVLFKTQLISQPTEPKTMRFYNVPFMAKFTAGWLLSVVGLIILYAWLAIWDVRNAPENQIIDATLSASS